LFGVVFQRIVKQGGNGFILTAAINEDKRADVQKVCDVRDRRALTDVLAVKLDSIR
jgi:hypothetical protein